MKTETHVPDDCACDLIGSCACCRKYTTDPHHVCEAVVLIERWTAVRERWFAGETSASYTPLIDVDQELRAYVARRREAQGEKP